MGITRRSKFGFPPSPQNPSMATVRAVPLSQGVRLDQPWPLLPPGSTTSMSNYLPLDGVLVPRSRLSSLNTIAAPGGSVLGLAHLVGQFAEEALWCSSSTIHGYVTSNGSISRASFVSSFGLGVASIAQAQRWEYAQVFMANINNNAIVAAPSSHGTLQVLYHTGGASAAAPLYSYLTSAPRTWSVGAFDNYLIAFSISDGVNIMSTRVQWCVRGNPSNWTGEGSGFEDLLEMKGNGTAVKTMGDARVILFSNIEIWYATSATYPAQFTFAALDTSVGCGAPGTIVSCDDGLLFFGTDHTVRLLPKGGGPSRPVSQPLGNLLRGLPAASGVFAVFDKLTKCYHLFISGRPIVVNTVTGEWAFSDYNTPQPGCGVSVGRSRSVLPGDESIYFGNSTGTVYSTNSKIATENGSVVTSTWRSAPLAADFPGDYKHLTQLDCDYRATSPATVTVKVSQDGGNSYGVTALPLSLTSAPVSGRATSQMHAGGAFPAIELTSTSTGYELHRLDVTLNLGGRR